ncbi:acyl-CoA dehydrogenase family protein [Nocardia sp. NPDC049707]|uniref:acyl-CoA dehydrogenase family protein n=1 Tax=Nocardia sp. NPDC049707 TaxID=3154735 RepID=UPI003429F13A
MSDPRTSHYVSSWHDEDALALSDIPVARERLIAGGIAAVAMETAVREAVEYAKDRSAFGQRLIDMQNT